MSGVFKHPISSPDAERGLCPLSMSQSMPAMPCGSTATATDRKTDRKTERKTGNTSGVEPMFQWLTVCSSQPVELWEVLKNVNTAKCPSLCLFQSLDFYLFVPLLGGSYLVCPAAISGAITTRHPVSSDGCWQVINTQVKKGLPCTWFSSVSFGVIF